MLTNLSAAQLRRAANIKDKIEKLQTELNRLMGAQSQSAQEAAPKKRKMSAAGRKRIAAAQKARWQKIKSGKK
jgi:hypothetical protein